MHLFISRPWALLTAIACAITTLGGTAAADIPPPSCQASAPSQEILNITTGNLSVSSNPFGLAYASNNVAFVAIFEASVGVLNTSTFPPTVIHELVLSAEIKQSAVSGLAITSDKKTLFVAVSDGAFVVDVERAIAGTPGFVLGFLNGTAGSSAIEVTLSLDDEYAFVSQEYGNNATGDNGAIEVFRVQRDKNNATALSTSYIGYTVLGNSVVGTALSPDGSRLYATSELAVDSKTQGALSVLDVATLKTDPSKALIGSVNAGCGPVRVITSPNGKHVWMTARESNMLLAFDAAKLEQVPHNSSVSISSTDDAIIASVQVGTSPVGLTFVNGGRQIITADSNRFGFTNTTTGLTVVNVEEALKSAGGGVKFPHILTGHFPRELAVSPDGAFMLVSQYGSKAVQEIDLRQLEQYC